MAIIRRPKTHKISDVSRGQLRSTPTTSEGDLLLHARAASNLNGARDFGSIQINSTAPCVYVLYFISL